MGGGRFGRGGAHRAIQPNTGQTEETHARLHHFDELAEAAVGEELGTSEWVEIDQERVDLFADATDDHQWIHVDLERAAAGPFGGTIAHGYLTLSLIPWLGSQVFTLETPGARLNYGLNKVRFPNPVRVGTRVRRHVTSATVTDLPTGKQVTLGTSSRSRARPSRPASPRPSSCCCREAAGEPLRRPGRSAAAGVRTPSPSVGDVVATVERGQGAVEALRLVGEQREQRRPR